MVPAHAEVGLQPVFLLVVQVYARHLRGVQSLSSASEAAASATRESHIVDIIGIGHRKDFQITTLVTAKESSGITVMRTSCEVDIEHRPSVHTPSDAEVEYRLLLAVLDAAHPTEVALHVVGIHAFHDRGRQVLHRRLRIARHELLAVDEDFLHLLAVDGNLSVVAHLCTRQLSYQFLHHRAFRCTEGVGIIDERVFLQHHLRGMGSDGRPFQHDRIGRQLDGSQRHVLLFLDGNLLRIGLKAHVRHLHRVRPVLGCLH